MPVTVNGVKYPYFQEGKGEPCIIVGLASLTVKCLSDNLKEQFCFYGSDLYWSKDDPAYDCTGKTMESFADDIEICRQQWGIDNVLLFAHSGTGFVAIEYARKYPQHVKGVVLLGACGYRNATETFEDFFEANASSERKLAYQQAQEQLDKIDLSKLSYTDRYVTEYVSKTAKFWYDFTKDNSCLWNDIVISQSFFEYYFATLLDAYDMRDTYPEIKTKIVVAAGRHDYIVPPFEWLEVEPEMSNLTLHIFEKSGHFPMLEEQELFDKLLLAWLK